MIIAITGTPGTGKSTTAKILAKSLNAEILDLEEIARKHKIVVEYDDRTMSMVIDEFKISDAIESETRKEKNYVIPSHLSQFVQPKLVELCVVLRCDPIILEKRLGKRAYSQKKIGENVMCEFLDACLIEAIEIGHKKHLHEIDTSRKSPGAVCKEIIAILNKKKKPEFGSIKWLM